MQLNSQQSGCGMTWRAFSRSASSSSSSSSWGSVVLVLGEAMLEYEGPAVTQKIICPGVQMAGKAMLK